MRYTKPLILAATLVAAPLAAQQVSTIDSGMTHTQVIERLGKPLSERTYGSFSYLLYKNGCEKKCGMNDLVVLDSEKVVDAVLRSPGRKYTGESSSPQMISAAEARRGPRSGAVRVPVAKGLSKTAADTTSPPVARPKTPLA